MLPRRSTVRSFGLFSRLPSNFSARTVSPPSFSRRTSRRPCSGSLPSHASNRPSRSKACPFAFDVWSRKIDTLPAASSLSVLLLGTSSKITYPSGCQAGPSPNFKSEATFSHDAPRASSGVSAVVVAEAKSKRQTATPGWRMADRLLVVFSIVMKTIVGLVQMRCTDDAQKNQAAAEKGIREAARRGARIVCLPELYRGLYFCQTEDHAQFARAEAIPGPSSKALGALAKS